MTLTDGQREALTGVCRKYLSETRYALAEDACLSPAALDEILKRRSVCEIVIGGIE